jgi:hypothetical protein
VLDFNCVTTKIYFVQVECSVIGAIIFSPTYFLCHLIRYMNTASHQPSQLFDADTMPPRALICVELAVASIS